MRWMGRGYLQNGSCEHKIFTPITLLEEEEVIRLAKFSRYNT
jgi:hypothetical protein